MTRFLNVSLKEGRETMMLMKFKAFATLRFKFGEYLVNRYALWLDFRTIDENELHGTGRHIENSSEGITLQIEKKEESAGALNAYIYLIMDAQLNIQNGTYVSAVY